MNKVISADGTPIAFERLGNGPPVIVVGGANCDLAIIHPLAEALAQHFTVINYDRRGRGNSSDTAPYTVEREIEDLAALLTDVGGTTSVYGHSAGAALVLHAAAHGLPFEKVILHDPPYGPDGEHARQSREYADTLTKLLADGRRSDAAALFMTKVGTPPDAVAGMRTQPWWARMEALAPTLAYDSQVMGDLSRGGAIPTEVLGKVTPPTLVLSGERNAPWMINAGKQIADGVPNGRHRLLPDQGHVVPPEVLVPTLVDYLVE